MNHVSVSPTNENGPGHTKTEKNSDQKKTLTRVVVSHTGQNFSLPSCGPISISRANAHMVHMGYKTSTSHYTLIS